MNAIYLEGNYLGMKVQAYQRPVPYKDVFVVDGITIQLPIKITEVDAVLLADKQKEDARQKKISSLGLTPEILDDAAQFKCEYYVAYLLTTNNFNHIYIDEVRQLYNQTKINFIMSNYTEAQQAFIIKSVEADKECSKYAKF
ncbi:MAG: hypothetical protein MJZ65_05980 [Paludibacteraceae bacterium]|nr:hypothetical protein [Paludibacteraceae bacterium]